MKNAHDISAKEIINKNPVTASKEGSLKQLKNKMEDNDLRAIPVVDNEDNFVGAAGYRELIRWIQFNPETTKVKKVLHQPPEFEESDSLVELCDLRINSGRKMLVNLNGKKLNGVISDNEFLQGFADAVEIGKISTRDLATYDLFTSFEEDKLEEARHKMLDNNVSRLPVIDSDGNLTGIVSSVEIMRTMIKREVQNSGGTSGGRSGRDEVNIAGGKEKDSMSDITVSELMDRTPCMSEEHLDGDKAVEKMIKEDSHEIIFTSDGYPNELITAKDFIAYVADFSERDYVLVQLTGLDVPEEKAVVNKKIKNQLQGSLGRKLERPKELTLRFKKAEKDGKKHRYELDMKLFSEYGTTTINEDGWELMDVVDSALDQMNRVVRDKKEKRSEHQ